MLCNPKQFHITCKPCNVEFPYANFLIIDGQKWCSYIYPIDLYYIEIENSTKILLYKVSYIISCSSHWLLIIKKVVH